MHVSWGRDDTKMHYAKKAGWWILCDCLVNVLQETLGPAIDLMVTLTTYPSLIADHVHPFSSLILQDNINKEKKWFRNCLRNTTTAELLTLSPSSPDLYTIERTNKSAL